MTPREPRVRKDGLCALKTCRKPRKLSAPGSSLRIKTLERELRLDPFCSANCARKHYTVRWPTTRKEATA